MRVLRATVFVLLIVLLLAATSFVMGRNRKMSLFLQARDRMEGGEEPALVLRHLSAAVDWDVEDEGAAALIVREALGGERAGGARVHRAGPYALIRASDGETLVAELLRGRWTRIP